jgi:luciferase-type oxidoreductase
MSLQKEAMDFPKINKGFNSVFKPGKISFGVFFPIEAYSGAVPKMEKQIMLGQKVEQLGFSALWFRDIPLLDPQFGDAGQIFDPWVYLSYVAAHTTRVALVTGSIVLPLRHPIHVAKAAASIDQLSNGRLILGVGIGDRPREYQAFGIEHSGRQRAFRESFTKIKKIWNDFSETDRKERSIYSDLDLLPKPTAGKVPLLVTGSSGQDLEWIATHADGWIYYPRELQVQQENILRFRNELKKLSLSDKPFAQSLYIDLSGNDDERPTPIHLGYRLGSKSLASLLGYLRDTGVNHIVFNLKYGVRPADEVLERLGKVIHSLPQ